MAQLCLRPLSWVKENKSFSLVLILILIEVKRKKIQQNLSTHTKKKKKKKNVTLLVFFNQSKPRDSKATCLLSLYVNPRIERKPTSCLFFRINKVECALRNVKRNSSSLPFCNQTTYWQRPLAAHIKMAFL